MTSITRIDGNDLVISRHIAAPAEAIWSALTDAEALKQWFVPRPWRISDAVIEPRPGGRFRTVMVGPEGQSEECGDEEGCVLEAVPNRRIVWTDALSGGYRPNAKPFMTAIITLEPQDGGGTLYTARVLHASEDDRRRHEEMGFADGWGRVIEQLAELLE